MERSNKLKSTYALVLLCFVVKDGVQGQSVGPDTDPSLKLHYDFDEDFSNGRVIDISGNGNDGWQFNPTNRITATNGVFGSAAAKFTYVGFVTNDPPQIYPLSQYLGVTNLNGIAFLTNGTISLWARFDATNNGNYPIYLMDSAYNVIYASSPSLASNSWTWGKGNFDNYLSLWVYPSAGGGQTIVTWPSDTVGFHDRSTANYHLYSVTIDCPANQVIAYYDGQPYQTNTINLPWIRIYGCSSIRWLCIGCMSHDGTPYWGDDRYPNTGFFDGKLDDVRIYNRTLSAAEIQALYLGSIFVRNLAIRLHDSQSVQLAWVGASNVQYQLESEAALNLNSWTALGPVSPGTGGTNSVIDSTLDQSNRFYRVRVLAR